MLNFLRGLGKFLAVLCAILFALTAVIALLLFNLERRMFEPQFYTQALEDEGLFERLPAVAAEAIVASLSSDPCPTNPVACNLESQPPELIACLSDALGPDAYLTISQNRRDPNAAELQIIQPCFDRFGRPAAGETDGPPAFMKNLTARDWEIIINAILPPEELRTLMKESLTQVFAVLNGQSQGASISLAGLKTRLGGEEGYQALQQLMRAQPPCTAEQIEQILASGPTGGVLCNPNEEQLARIEPSLRDGLSETADRIPDTAPLLPGGAAYQGLSLARFIMRLSLLLPIGLLLAITLFAVRSLRGLLRWWGAPLLSAAILGILLALTLQPVFRFLFILAMNQIFPMYLPQGLLEAGANVLGSLLHALLEPFALQNLILGLIGLGMLIGSFFARNEERAG